MLTSTEFLHTLYLNVGVLYGKFYKSNISSLDDFNHKTAHDLYNICSQDYILTIKGYGIDIKSVPFHSFPIKKVAFFHQKKSLHHWNKSGDGELFCFRLLLNSHN